MNERTRVLVADDSVLIRQGLVAMLGASEQIEVVAECDALDALERAISETDVDVVITDIRMPPTHSTEGIDAALWIRSERPDTGVIVLSQFSEPEYVAMLFARGSDGLGYLLKERLGDLEQLEQAIDVVARGGSALDPKIIDLMVQGERARGSAADPAIDSLTPRECDVLALIAEGLNNATIAERLVVSQKAVAKHINNIFSKLGLAEDPESDRRVRAVLLWLASR